MIRSIWVLSKQAYTMRFREKVYIGGIFAVVAAIFFAHLVDSWGTKESNKMIDDALAFGLNLIGSILAIIWGSQGAVGGKEKSLYASLTAPISRSTWFFAQYLGTVGCLTSIAIIFFTLWQLSFLTMNYDLETLPYLQVFFCHSMSWAVVAAMSSCLACLCSQTLCLFASLAGWFVGLTTPILAQIGPTGKEQGLTVVQSISSFWNLQHFNISKQDLNSDLPWLFLIGYAFFTIVFFILAGTFRFKQKDL